MRRLFAIYLIGIALQVWPVVQAQWNTTPASRLTVSVAERLPNAAAWPIRVWDRASKILAVAGLTAEEPQQVSSAAPAVAPIPQP